MAKPSPRRRRSRRGVALVEHLFAIVIGLLLAVVLASTSSRLFGERFQRVLDAVYSSAP